jgi:hypothetical protein
MRCVAVQDDEPPPDYDPPPDLPEEGLKIRYYTKIKLLVKQN